MDNIVINTFSARAECNRDMIELLKADIWFKRLRWEPMFEDCGAEILIEFETNATLEELRAELRKIIDTHVLLQTLRQCPLKDNSLKRDWDLH